MKRVSFPRYARKTSVKKHYNNSPPTLVSEGVFDVVVEGEATHDT